MEKKFVDSSMSRRIVTVGFVMSCIVVMIHCGNGEMAPVSSLDKKWDILVTNLFNNLHPLTMSYFFTATGFLFFFGFRMEDYPQKMKRRLFSLLVPYFLWQILCSILFGALLNQFSLSFCLQSIFLLQKWPPDGPLWYMYAVFLLALGNPFLYFLFRNKKVGFISLIFLVVLIQIVRTSDNPTLYTLHNYGYLPSIFSYLPAYLTASYIGLHADESDHDLGIILCLLLISLILDARFDGFFQFYTIRLLPLLILYLLPDFCLIDAPRLTNLSFLLYAVHRILAGFGSNQIRILLQKIIPSAAFSNFFGRFLTFLCILAICWILWRILSHFTPPLLKLLTGGRTKPYSAFMK